MTVSKYLKSNLENKTPIKFYLTCDDKYITSSYQKQHLYNLMAQSMIWYGYSIKATPRAGGT